MMQLLLRRAALQSVSLRPEGRLRSPRGASARMRTTVKIWNAYGGLIQALADELRVEPAVAIAVLAVESGGKGFGDRHRLIVRFENHIFASQWGAQHRDTFDQHFRYDPRRRWLDHQFRARESDAWSDVHGAQTREWKAFNFARILNAAAAYRSISMGASQIMGFNHSLVGYRSAKAMFDAFSADIRPQLIGLFDFAQRRDPGVVDALRRRDFFTFAGFYNGFGSQQPIYRDLLNSYYDAFHALGAPTAPLPHGATTHEVRRGDTLSGIASRFQTTVDALVLLNGIANPDLIVAGTALRVIPLVPPDDALPGEALRAGAPSEMEQERGLLVIGCDAGGPAGQAGLLLGDVLLTLADEPLQETDELLAALDADRIDQPQPLRIFRAGVVQTLTVVPVERT